MDSENGAPFFRPSPGSGKLDPNAVMSHAAVTVTAAGAIPAPEQHHQTAAFAQPRRMIVLGIDRSGRFAAVLCCAATTTAATGPLDYAYLMWLKTEQHLYKRACQLRVAAQPDQLDVERVRLGLIRTIDPVLRQPIDELLKEWEKIPRTESKAVTTVPVTPRSKPASRFECLSVSLQPVSTPSAVDVVSPWSFWLVEVPRKAPRRETQLPGYKQVTGLQWPVTDECVPVIAFTETHVVALYDHRDGAGLVVDCATLHRDPGTKKWSAARVWMYRIPPPPKEGGINYLLRVSEDGTVAWATGYTVWVFGPPFHHQGTVLVFQFEPHVCLTSMALCNTTRMLTVGTSRGEVLAFNWETTENASLDMILTPFEEPVLAVHRDPAAQGRNLALTISAVQGRLVPGRMHEFKTLEMERPTAMAAAGNCILFSNKYGKVEVYTGTLMRGLLDIPKDLPLVRQTTWDGGVWCNAQGEMAAQMHDGTVHWWK